MWTRRRFLGAVGLTAGGWRAMMGPTRGAGKGAPPVGPQAPGAKPYGSGYFGEWIEDPFGLPAYRYTCDQASDARARSPVNPEFRAPTNHTHQVGNDRLVAAVSNYGYVQVRQDEGSPKFLNDFSPERGLYGGGIGYLTDGRTVLSTYYPGNGEAFERTFGVGYLRKKVTGSGYIIDQVIFAPFGDDPVLISQATLTNQGTSSADLRWVEYWGAQAYQFSYRSFMESAAMMDQRKAPELRRRFAERFTHRFQLLDGPSGLLESKQFQGRAPEDEKIWAGLQKFMAANPSTFLGPAFEAPTPDAAMEDLNPPPTFLLSLDAAADAFSTNARTFFGTGGVRAPSGLAEPLDGRLDTAGPEAALLLERRVSLKPGETRTLYFAYGYLPQDVELEKLTAKYRHEASALWARSSDAWKRDGLQFSVASEPWVKREVTWHHYYLRSNLTYDDFFREHILSQGHVYQYLMGFQGAARDPLQHALPFVFTRPEIVREVLRYTLKEVHEDGFVPYGIVGHGMPMPVIFRPSDQQLWLLWLASEYVLATRDTAFLREELPTYPLYGPKAGKATVRDLLARCYRQLVEVIGTGEHGLMRLSNGDWNDNAVVGFVPPNLFEEVRKRAESVLNAAMATYVLDHYARLLDYVGDASAAAEARARAEAQRQAVRAQWTGQWFRRAWLTPELGWIGEDQIWLEPQPWAIIGGAATPQQARTLVQALDEKVRRPSPLGAMLHSKGVPKMSVTLGDGTNAGVWPSINGTLIWALAKVDAQRAWDEWKKNSLARHAATYPEIWYGIWSGPDTYNSVLSQHPGETMRQEDMGGLGMSWVDFPVMNMHPHAWPLYSAVKLFATEFSKEGVELAPALPVDSYRFESPLLGLAKSSQGYEGWYAPLGAGRWTVALRLPPEEAARFKNAVINGKKRRLAPSADGVVKLIGESFAGKPLRWSLPA